VSHGAKQKSQTAIVAAITDIIYPSHTITYNANGGALGSVPATQPKYQGITEYITHHTPTRQFYNFNNWLGGGNILYIRNHQYTANENLSLTARWLIRHEITLNQSEPHTFTTSEYGNQPAAHTVTMKNTGNEAFTMTAALSGANAASFSLTAPSATLSKDASANFTVRPNANLPVGTHTATVTVSGGEATAPSFNVSFEVTKRFITIAADANSKFYGTSDPALTVTVTSGNWVTGDVFTGALSREPGEHLGSYEISQGTLSAGGNYTITGFTPANFEITQKPITVRANDINITYGDAAPPYTSYTYYIAEGAPLAPGEELDVLGDPHYECGYAAGDNAGSYDITLSGLSSGNYDISYAEPKGKVVVGKAAVEPPVVSAHNIIIDYTEGFNINLDDLLPALDGSLVYGDVSYSAVITVNQNSILAGAAVSGSELAVVVGNGLTADDNDGDQAAVTVTVVSGNYGDFDIVIPFAASAKTNISGSMTLEDLTVASSDSPRSVGEVLISGNPSLTQDNILYTYEDEDGNVTDTWPTAPGVYTVTAKIVNHPEFSGSVTANLVVIPLYDIGKMIHDAVDEHEESLLGEFFNNVGSGSLVLEEASILGNSAIANILSSGDRKDLITEFLSNSAFTPLVPPSSPISGILSSASGAQFTFELPVVSDDVAGLPDNADFHWSVDVAALNPDYLPGAGYGSVVMGNNGKFTVVPPAHNKPPLLVAFIVQVNPAIPIVMAVLPAPPPPPCNSSIPGCPGYVGGGSSGGSGGGYVVVGGSGGVTIIDILAAIGPEHLTFDLSPKTYSGYQQPVSVTSVFVGTGTITVMYNGSVNPPVNAGVYTVSASVSGGSTFAPGAAVLGSYVIEKKEPSASDFSYTRQALYTGEPRPLSLSKPAGMGEVAVIRYNGSAEAPSATGVYAVSVDVVAGTNYKAVSELSLGSYEISTTVSITGSDRVIIDDADETGLIAPVKTLSAVFTAGPNPVSKSVGSVTFFWQGRAVNKSVLSVFDAQGNLVAKVTVSDDGKGIDRRVVGSWGLTDRKGRPVAEGTYLIRGVITTRDGGRERVAFKVGVR